MRCAPLVSLGLIGLLVLGHPGRAVASQDAYAQYAEQLQAAESAVQNGDSEAGISAFVAAYEVLPQADRATRLGSDVVDRVARLAQEAYLSGSKNRASLEQALDLVRSHLADLRRLAPDVDVEIYLQYERRLQAALATTQGGDAPAAAEEPTAPPPVSTSTKRGKRGDDESRERTDEGSVSPSDAGGTQQIAQRRTLGFVLLGIGIGAMGGGAGWIGYANYYRVRRFPDDQEKCAPNACDPAWEDQQRTNYAVHYAIGSIVAAAGVAMTATGVVFLVKSRRGRAVAQVTAVPWGSGAAITGRF